MSTFSSNQGAATGLRRHRAVTVAVLGSCGFLCFICGIIAFVMGQNDLKEMDAGLMDRSGRDLTNVGRILGLIFTIFSILMIMANIIMFLISRHVIAAVDAVK